ncbi:MAG TPA: alpha-amylase family glycosyl hydrolase [Balneolaceae bacterium]|nr:alpha-amylase family glycosyl hydrolase [Balneolaceae bacterium]
MKFNNQLLLKRILTGALLLFFSIGFWGCTKSKADKLPQPHKVSNVKHPEWARNANIYEVNIRQYTPEGTFKAFQKQLPRLKKMGVKILWLMPINPIGEKNRKGPLGSYYSVKNYKAVNPNYGTMQDFKDLVKAAHDQGMKVIIDWVANHTSWDNVWTKEHPDWYNHDKNGNFVPPVKDWSDVIDLNYDNKQMRNAMIDAMKYWINEANIDGYRCDYAMGVPNDFWDRARKELDQIKPVFMLAESELPSQQKDAFDMTYAWQFHHLITAIHKGKKSLSDIDTYMAEEDTEFAPNDYRMYFTTNHDENSWQGSDTDMFGKNFQNFAVLAATIDGMPLVYSGQESGLDYQLAFFKKDTIRWDHYKYQKFYSTLLHLNTNNPALWNGKAGGDFQRVKTDPTQKIYAYKRIKGDREVFVVLNFGDTEQKISLTNWSDPQEYTNVFTNKTMTIGGNPITVAAHDFYVFEK